MFNPIIYNGYIACVNTNRIMAKASLCQQVYYLDNDRLVRFALQVWTGCDLLTRRLGLGHTLITKRCVDSI